MNKEKQRAINMGFRVTGTDIEIRLTRAGYVYLFDGWSEVSEFLDRQAMFAARNAGKAAKSRKNPAARLLDKAAQKTIEAQLKAADYSGFRWQSREVMATHNRTLDKIYISYETNDDETKARVKSVFPADADLATLRNALVADLTARTRKNPAPRSGDVQGAKRLAARFHGREPGDDEFFTVAKPTIPDAMANIGQVFAIEYLAERDGTVYRFRHVFRSKSRPQLAVSPDGDFVTMLGGAWNFSEDGFIDR